MGIYSYLFRNNVGSNNFIDNNHSLSSEDIKQLSAHIAHATYHLVHARQNAHVVILLERSIEALVTMIGVARAGATYVPLEPASPVQRFISLLNDLQPEVIITTKNIFNQLETKAKQVVQEKTVLYIDELLSQTNKNTQFIDLSSDEHPVYIIYTSGSSGVPKGVIINLASLTHYLFWAQSHFKKYIEEEEEIIFDCSASIAVDFSVTMFFLPFLTRNSSVYFYQGDKIHTVNYARYIIKNRINYVKWTPSFLHILINNTSENLLSQFPEKMYIIIGGEKRQNKDILLWLKIHPKHIFVDEYGPTELAVGVFRHVITKENVDFDSMGKIRNKNIYYILNKNMQRDKKGELYIAGPGMADGYLDKEENTRENFIKNPFDSSEKYNRIYNTKDCVCLSPEGCVQYLGRSDDFVKIQANGFHLNEINNVLLQLKKIKASYVMTHNENLVYFIQKKESVLTKKDIKLFIKDKLPSFMHPKDIYFIGRIPVKDNGKINKEKLISYIDDEVNNKSESTFDKIINIWKSVSGLDEIQKDKTFSEQGIDSILAIYMLSDLSKAFNEKFSVQWLISNNTPRLQSSDINKLINKGSLANERRNKLINCLNRASIPKGIIFLAHPSRLENNFVYLHIIEKLKKLYNIYGINSYNLIFKEDTIKNYSDLGKAYVSEVNYIINEHSDLSVSFIGWSMGGILELEIARNICTPSKIIMIGTVFPEPNVIKKITSCHSIFDSAPREFIEKIKLFIKENKENITLLNKEFVEKNNMFSSYSPARWNGKALYISGKDEEIFKECWKNVINNIQFIDTSEGHFDLIQQHCFKKYSLYEKIICFIEDKE